MAAQSQYEAQAAARVALAGRIERDMREAYYRWLQARAQIGIFDTTLELATENRRVNESLFRNGKIPRDLVFGAAGERRARAALQPKLDFAFDVGTQGETYGFTQEDRYLLASVVLKFNFFAGGGDEAGIASARAVERQARANRSLQEQQIRFH